jgi:hypothetical protein
MNKSVYKTKKIKSVFVSGKVMTARKWLIVIIIAVFVVPTIFYSCKKDKPDAPPIVKCTLKPLEGYTIDTIHCEYVKDTIPPVVGDTLTLPVGNVEQIQYYLAAMQLTIQNGYKVRIILQDSIRIAEGQYETMRAFGAVQADAGDKLSVENPKNYAWCAEKLHQVLTWSEWSQWGKLKPLSGWNIASDESQLFMDDGANLDKCFITVPPPPIVPIDKTYRIGNIDQAIYTLTSDTLQKLATDPTTLSITVQVDGESYTITNANKGNAIWTLGELRTRSKNNPHVMEGKPLNYFISSGATIKPGEKKVDATEYEYKLPELYDTYGKVAPNYQTGAFYVSTINISDDSGLDVFENFIPNEIKINDLINIDKLISKAPVRTPNDPYTLLFNNYFNKFDLTNEHFNRFRFDPKETDNLGDPYISNRLDWATNSNGDIHIPLGFEPKAKSWTGDITINGGNCVNDVLTRNLWAAINIRSPIPHIDPHTEPGKDTLYYTFAEKAPYYSNGMVYISFDFVAQIMKTWAFHNPPPLKITNKNIGVRASWWTDDMTYSPEQVKEFFTEIGVFVEKAQQVKAAQIPSGTKVY